MTQFIDYHIRRGECIELARLHQEAFPGFFLTKLGLPFLVQFYSSFVDEKNIVTVVARDVDGLPIGVAVGSLEPKAFYRRLLLKRFFGFARASILTAMRNPSMVPRLLGAFNYRGSFDDVVKGALLSSICVKPAVVGTGVGRELLSSWRQRARQLGATRAYLTTDAEDNTAANNFYLRDNWALQKEYETANGRLMNLYVRDLVEEVSL